MKDSISLSPMTVGALNRLGLGDFNGVELPERMAYVVLVLRRLEDRDEWFPLGKSATIQAIEQQLGECADAAADGINRAETMRGWEHRADKAAS